MKRDIITIDESLCDGCGLCAPNCPEGAIRIVDGKAKLVGDIFCDGLGACLGNCPRGAITIEKREAAPYDERRAMENIIAQGPEAVRAHLEHLEDHGEQEYYREAVSVLREKGLEVPVSQAATAGPLKVSPAAARTAHPEPVHDFGGCPGSRSFGFTAPPASRQEKPVQHDTEISREDDEFSALTHWPVQLHLINPRAPHYSRSHLLLAADCTAFSLGGFHGSFLRGKTLAIACPKLDSDRDVYVEKLAMLIDDAAVETITVMIMEVPCCGGLLETARAALRKARRKVPLKKIVVSVRGSVLQEVWE